MILSDVERYVEQREKEGLTKIEFTLEHTETISGFDVTKTKETYTFYGEDEADAKVDEIRQDPKFAGVDKKFKQGKANKAGEITRPDTYTVVGKFNF